MATVVLHPDPIGFPVGSKPKIRERTDPHTPYSGEPPGSILSEPTIASDGSLTVTVTPGHKYVGYLATGGIDRYLLFEAEEASGAGTVSSVNGKEGAVNLTATDVGAEPEGGAAGKLAAANNLSDVASASTSRTNLGLGTVATHAAAEFEAAGAAAAEASRAETAEATKLVKASNLSDLTNAGTARTNLGLGTAATHAHGDYDAAGTAATAQAAAEAASTPRLGVHAAVSTNGTTATVEQLTPVNDEAESRTIKLPTGQAAGTVIAVEKTSSTAGREVTIEGSLRGVAEQTIKLRLGKQVATFIADSSGSWWPIAMYIPLATLSTDYVLRTLSIPAGQVPGNELLAEWKITLHGSEKRTIVSARIRTSSGTIKVAIKRGSTGTTEIAAYKALAGAETEEVVESEQALSDGDRITVTSSAGSSPKGLFIDIWEKVEK